MFYDDKKQESKGMIESKETQEKKLAGRIESILSFNIGEKEKGLPPGDEASELDEDKEVLEQKEDRPRIQSLTKLLQTIHNLGIPLTAEMIVKKTGALNELFEVILGSASGSAPHPVSDFLNTPYKINPLDQRGETTFLILAVQYCPSWVVQYLLDKGANPKLLVAIDVFLLPTEEPID